MAVVSTYIIYIYHIIPIKHQKNSSQLLDYRHMYMYAFTYMYIYTKTLISTYKGAN